MRSCGCAISNAPKAKAHFEVFRSLPAQAIIEGKTMLKLTAPDISRLMYRAIEQMQKEQVLPSSREMTFALNDVFPFHPEDVEGVHTHKIDEGKGVWFRLKDGRVFTRRGELAPDDPALYDRQEKKQTWPA
jgi:hypothetical protein